MDHLFGHWDQGHPSAPGAPAAPLDAGGRPNCVAPVRPARAVATAVLAVVAAGLVLASVALVLVGTLAGDTTADAWTRATGVVLTSALGAAGLLGALFLYRGTGRTLVLLTASTETVLVAVPAVWAAEQLIGDSSTRPAVAGGVLVGALAAATLTGAQVRLALSPPVGRWLEATARLRASRPAPARAARTGLGTALAVVAPAAVLAVVTVGVVLSAGPPGDRGTDPTVPVVPAGELRSPVAPPAAGDPGWSAEFDRTAQQCFAGSMTACDDLYWESSVGDVYEAYGSTCGGRLSRQTAGGCGAALGARLN